MKKVVAILLVLVLAVAFCACGKKNKADVEGAQAVEPMQNVQAMMDYAQMLEEQGNHDAAAKVWALIPEAAEQSAREEVIDDAENNDELRALEQLSEANAYAQAAKGEGK